MEENTSLITGILTGIALGFLMAAGLLVLIRICDYPLFDLRFYVILIIAAFLPFCLTFLRRMPVNIMMVKIIMTAVSFLILLLYAGTAAKDAVSYQRLMTIDAVLHLGAAAGILVSEMREKES